jgi:hypothetical protein
LTHPIFEFQPRNLKGISDKEPDIMSIRTGNRARHNRRKKQHARNRVRIRLLRATLAEAANTAAKPATEAK